MPGNDADAVVGAAPGRTAIKRPRPGAIVPHRISDIDRRYFGSYKAVRLNASRTGRRADVAFVRWENAEDGIGWEAT